MHKTKIGLLGMEEISKSKVLQLLIEGYLIFQGISKRIDAQTTSRGI